MSASPNDRRGAFARLTQALIAAWIVLGPAAVSSPRQVGLEADARRLAAEAVLVAGL